MPPIIPYSLSRDGYAEAIQHYFSKQNKKIAYLKQMKKNELYDIIQENKIDVRQELAHKNNITTGKFKLLSVDENIYERNIKTISKNDIQYIISLLKNGNTKNWKYQLKMWIVNPVYDDAGKPQL